MRLDCEKSCQTPCGNAPGSSTTLLQEASMLLPEVGLGDKLRVREPLPIAFQGPIGFCGGR